MKCRLILRRAAAVLSIAGIAVVAFAAGWGVFWSFCDWDIRVPAPARLRVEALAGAREAKVLFLGDFAPTDSAMPYIERHGYGYQFSRTAERLAAYDAVVANLEAPITNSDSKWPLPKQYSYKIDPAAVPAIARAGIDVVTLANNHSHDYGSRGLEDTIRALDGGGVAHIGAAMTESEARRGMVLETAGGALGILSYLEDKISWRLWTLSYALDLPFHSWPGSARALEADLAEDIARLRKNSDAVAVVFHFGENYQTITPRQKALARLAIDLGADAVIGHHAHQAQPLGTYRGRPIVYNLGNYAWGAIGHPKMRYGMGAALVLEAGRIRGIEILPLVVQNRIVKYQPRVPVGRDLDAFFTEMTEGSRAFGARLERRGDIGWIDVADEIE
jgi:poly-gamma-glutamate capsule biosynthesis protein CapA/YwtB (metallophosphatase superfamily)